jgi:2-isopropylmalate synthase
VANTLVAVRAGAVHVQGTINGYGERVANANLCSILPDLQLKMGFSCLPPDALTRLTELSRFVAEVANLAHDNNLPYVGASAFAHKGGLHVAAVLKNEDTYQHVNPALVGNQRRTVVSELAGRGNVADKAGQFGLDVNSQQTRAVLEQIKQLEAQGFTFEGAEASVELMLRRAHPSYVPPFELIDFMVVVERRRGRGLLAEATVKVRVGPKLCTPPPRAMGRSTPWTPRCARRWWTSTPSFPASSWPTTRYASWTATPAPPPTCAC